MKLGIQVQYILCKHIVERNSTLKKFHWQGKKAKDSKETKSERRNWTKLYIR